MSNRLCHTSSAFRTHKTDEQLKSCVSKEDTDDWLYDNKPNLLTAGEKQEVLKLRAKRKEESKLKKTEDRIEKVVKKKAVKKRDKKPNTLEQLRTKLHSQGFVGIDEFENVKASTLNKYIVNLRTNHGIVTEVIRAEGQIIGWKLIKKTNAKKNPNDCCH